MTSIVVRKRRRPQRRLTVNSHSVIDAAAVLFMNVRFLWFTAMPSRWRLPILLSARRRRFVLSRRRL